eukprot:scaffold1817_cov250-Pinguiococcus_pyrenoidosus.AAC.4
MPSRSAAPVSELAIWTAVEPEFTSELKPALGVGPLPAHGRARGPPDFAETLGFVRTAVSLLFFCFEPVSIQVASASMTAKTCSNAPR